MQVRHIVSGELTIYRAAELREELLAAIERAPQLALDLSGVSEIDTAGVQLLIGAQREAARRQGHLVITDPSPAVRKALGMFRLEGELHIH